MFYFLHFLSRKILICFKTPSYCHSTVLNIATKGFNQFEYRTTGYFNINLSVITTTIPLARPLKAKWFQMHRKHCFALNSKNFKSILIGDSLMPGLNRYYKIRNNFFKPIDALNCGIGGDKVQNVLWRVQNLPISSSLKNAVILCGTNNLLQDSPEDIVDGIIEIGHCFKKRHHNINIFICGLLPRDECTSINRVYIIKTNKILKVKRSLNKFFFIDQDTYWTQPNGCLNPDMFYLDKLHLAEKGNLVLPKSICMSIEYSHRIVTRNEFKTLYKLATAFQLNNADFPILSSKYVRKAVSGCTKVPSSKFISIVVVKPLRKFACVRKLVSVPKFAQIVRSPSYHVVKRCDFDILLIR